jgi:hypothetical protein
MSAKYQAQLDTGVATYHFTMRSARDWAESYGTTANRCTIQDRMGRIVGEHRRDPNGDGTRWFRATVTREG